MNYRHHFHAGNFADVMKHALLVELVRALQKKEKGFLYLDTHAGRGRYDLTEAAPLRRVSGAPEELVARKPEWPDGIGRLWSRADLPPALAAYVNLVRDFDRRGGNIGPGVRFYPGSPCLVRSMIRAQDRMALLEKHPAEVAALRGEFTFASGVSIQEMDGYGALRAMLPPFERRALVLIDPPFEAQDEFAQIVAAMEEGLVRFPSGVFAIWYPLTERARVEEFFGALRELRLPPTLSIEVAVAGPQSLIKMKGCGLVVVNPPWHFDTVAAPIAGFLANALEQAPGAGEHLEWIVAER